MLSIFMMELPFRWVGYASNAVRANYFKSILNKEATVHQLRTLLSKGAFVIRSFLSFQTISRSLQTSAYLQLISTIFFLLHLLRDAMVLNSLAYPVYLFLINSGEGGGVKTYRRR